MRSSSSTPRDGALTRRLSRAARPRVAGRPAFRVCAGAGLLAAFAVAAGVVALRGGSLLALAVIVVASLGTFLAVVAVNRLVTGDERLVYHHHAIAVLAVAAGVAALVGEPVLAALDAVALGLGTLLACGRVGCFMAGCCHGRPHRWGVKYGHAHTVCGLEPALVGVRLFPVQLVEAALAAGLVAVGTVLVARGAAPGAAFAWYVGAHAVVRFGLEPARGDVGRPHRLGFSQPQWLSLACAGAIALLAALGVTPWAAVDASVVVIAAGMLVATLRRRAGADRPATDLAHVHELVEAIRLAGAAHPAPVVTRTSRGVRVSAGPGHVTLSGAITDRAARALAGYAMGAVEVAGRPEVRPGRNGTFHLVARPWPDEPRGP